MSTSLVYDLNVLFLAEFPPKNASENVRNQVLSLRTMHRSPLGEVYHIFCDTLQLLA